MKKMRSKTFNFRTKNWKEVLSSDNAWCSNNKKNTSNEDVKHMYIV